MIKKILMGLLMLLMVSLVTATTPITTSIDIAPLQTGSSLSALDFDYPSEQKITAKPNGITTTEIVIGNPNEFSVDVNYEFITETDKFEGHMFPYKITLEPEQVINITMVLNFTEAGTYSNSLNFEVIGNNETRAFETRLIIEISKPIDKVFGYVIIIIIIIVCLYFIFKPKKQEDDKDGINTRG